MSTSATPLVVRNLAKRFGGTIALAGVDLAVRGGEIHALLGENGAGKSTLIKILAGVVRADDGQVVVDGLDLEQGALAEHLAIAFVHQDLGLIGSLTVAENIALVAGYPSWHSLIRWKAVRRHAVTCLAGIAAAVEPSRLVSTLSPAEQSLVAISRAMSRPARVLVLDEPTATLPEHDVARLLDSLDELRARGVGILYVTHRLDEIFRIADRVTVLRSGRRVLTREVSAIDTKALVSAIVGRESTQVRSRPATARGERLLEVESLAIKGGNGVSFHVDAGEIVGLVGLRGAGHEQVARALIGDSASVKGKVTFQDRAGRPRDPAAAFALGFGFVSSRRAEEGLASGLTVRENLFPNHKLVFAGSAKRGNGLVVSRRTERGRYTTVAEKFNVRPRGAGERLIETLSGGNQQKVILARWFTAQSKLLILEEPTYGVDVGARVEIYDFIYQMLESGTGVLLVSSEFDEVVRLVHRALVFNRGRIIASVAGGDLTVPALTRLAASESNDDDVHS